MPELAPLLTPDRGDLAEQIREFHRQASPWVPAGLGNHLHWGPPLPQPSPALSCTNLNRIIEHAVEDFTVTVEAGLPLADLQAALAEKNQWLAIDPPLAGASSIGGLVARGLSGRLRHRYLNLRDQIIGISLLRADGTGAKAGGRVVKNVAGYDLMRLFCGSWGSLGLITELSLRTQPIPPLRQLLRAEGGAAGLQQLRQQLLLQSPLALELLEWRQGPGSESTQGQAHKQGQPWLDIGLVSLDATALADQKEQLQALVHSVRTVRICGVVRYPAPRSRRSNENGSSLISRMLRASGWSGLSRMLRSTWITADGTLNATVRILRSQAVPIIWSSGGTGTSAQAFGKPLISNTSVAQSAGISRVRRRRSAGAVSGST